MILHLVLSCIMLAIIFAPLGCVVLWKRYAYFGDGLAHASLLAAIISSATNLSAIYSGILFSIVFVFAVLRLRKNVGNDAIIGVLANVTLSIALLIYSLYPGKVGITNFLVGDILFVTTQELWQLSLLSLIVIVFLVTQYRKLVLMTISSDIARSRYIPVAVIEFCFLLILASAILLTTKIVGVLLVISIILIPAIIARLISVSPALMIIYAVIIAALTNLCGLVVSFYADVPIAPSIVLIGFTGYLALLLIKYIVK